MLRQDPHIKNRGLAKVSGQFVSSGGIIKHPQPIIVPLPLIEDVNTTKVVNDPKTLGAPVDTSKDIFAESKPEKKQEETLKKDKLEQLTFTKTPVPRKAVSKKRKNPDSLFFDF